MTATAPEYQSPLLSIPEALRELARARNDSDGRTAARELMRALRDGALTLLDNNDRQAPDIVSKALRFIRAFIDRTPAASVAFEGTYLDRVFVVRQEFERVFGLHSGVIASPEKSQFKAAPVALIHDEIKGAYDRAELAGEPAPNIKQLPKQVRPRLNKNGYDAADNQIMNLGGEPQHKGRRRRQGHRLTPHTK
ncbi:MAG TPA: hypothetical protein VIJ35_09080 [Bradyrhizobium sp.]